MLQFTHLPICELTNHLQTLLIPATTLLSCPEHLSLQVASRLSKAPPVLPWPARVQVCQLTQRLSFPVTEHQAVMLQQAHLQVWELRGCQQTSQNATDALLSTPAAQSAHRLLAGPL